MRLFVQLQDGAPKAWPLTGENIRYLAPEHVSFPYPPEAYEQIDLSEFGFETFELSDPPSFDPATQRLVEVAPQKAGGVWVQQFTIEALP